MRILHLFDDSMFRDCEYSLRSCAILREQKGMDYTTEQVIINSQEIDGGAVADSGAKEEKIDNKVVDGANWESKELGDIKFKVVNNSGLFSNIPILNYCREFFQLRSCLRKLVDQFNPHIIHAHSPAIIGLAALQVGGAKQVPVVYELRSLWEDVDHNAARNNRFNRQIQQKLETHVIRHAGAVAVPSESLRRVAIERGANIDNIALIPNAGFPPSHAVSHAASPQKANGRDLKRQLGVENKTLLGYVGMLHAHEGVHLILQSLPILLQGVPDLHLLLVGDGPEQDNLRQQAAELGLSGQITFTGKVENEKLSLYFSVIDILIFPRLSTPVTEKVPPLMPLQAMANGHVVLASDVGGHQDYISHGDNGFLFRNGDKNALADAVVDVLIDKQSWSFVRERGVSFVKNERNWTASVANYKKIYSSLVVHQDA